MCTKQAQNHIQKDRRKTISCQHLINTGNCSRWPLFKKATATFPSLFIMFQHSICKVDCCYLLRTRLRTRADSNNSKKQYHGCFTIKGRCEVKYCPCPVQVGLPFQVIHKVPLVLVQGLDADRKPFLSTAICVQSGRTNGCRSGMAARCYLEKRVGVCVRRDGCCSSFSDKGTFRSGMKGCVFGMRSFKRRW